MCFQRNTERGTYLWRRWPHSTNPVCDCLQSWQASLLWRGEWMLSYASIIICLSFMKFCQPVIVMQKATNWPLININMFSISRPPGIQAADVHLWNIYILKSLINECKGLGDYSGSREKWTEQSKERSLMKTCSRALRTSYWGKGSPSNRTTILST